MTLITDTQILKVAPRIKNPPFSKVISCRLVVSPGRIITIFSINVKILQHDKMYVTNENKDSK